MQSSDYTVKAITAYLKDHETIDQDLLNQLEKDQRKGVQAALSRYKNKQKKKQKSLNHVRELRQTEKELHQKGYQRIAGTDEVGRGPLAGPVVTAAVILPEDMPPFSFDDSKKLSHQKRQQLVKAIEHYAVSCTVDEKSAEVIDQTNISSATKASMTDAIGYLNPQPDYVLTDAVHLPGVSQPQQNIIHGDATVYCIAAASIYAKEYRDQRMREYAKLYPEYGFERNMGYGTKEHLEALKKYGPCPIHRQSFSPVRNWRNL